MFTLVIVATSGNDLLELPLLRDKYKEGFLSGVVGCGDALLRAVDAASEEIVSLAT